MVSNGNGLTLSHLLPSKSHHRQVKMTRTRIHLFETAPRNLEMPPEMLPAKSPSGMSDNKNKIVSEPKQLVNAKAA